MMIKPLGAALAVILLLSAAFVLLPGASASKTPIMDEVLPSAREGTASAATPDGLYIIGGFDGNRLRDILHYDPAAGTLEPKTTQLPTGRTMAAAVWDGTYIHIIGGWTSQGFTDEILRYHPPTDTLETVAATLPSPRSHFAAAYDGTHIYIFGGWTPSGHTDQIVRYDPLEGTTSLMASTLPQPRMALTAAADGSTIVLIGGFSSGSTRHDDIHHYNGASDTLTLSSATLPAGRSHASSLGTDGAIYYFGGLGCNGGPCDTILRYYPSVQDLSITDTVLETPRQLTSAAKLDDHIYIIGGTGSTRYHEILRYSPTGAAPPGQSPQIDPIADQQAQVGALLSIDVQATHPNGNPLTLDAPTKPTGATFTDHGDGTGRLEWTPSSAQEGDHLVTIRATDGSREDTEDFQVTVLPADELTLHPIADRTVETETSLTIDIQAEDPHARSITLSISTLPEEATFTDHGDDTATLQWDIQSDQLGDWTFTVSATAGDDTAQRTFTVSVTQKIHPPEIAPIADQAIPTGTNSQITIQATHPENAPITLGAQPIPSGATFTDHGDGTATLAWAPTTGQMGHHTITIEAESHGKKDTETFTLNVVPRLAMQLQATTGLHNTMSPGETRTFEATVTNTGYETLTVYLHGRTHLAHESGWQLAPTQNPITLQAGETADIGLIVTAPAHATGITLRLEATGRTDDNQRVDRVTHWMVDVPVVVQIQLEHTRPSLLIAATQGIQGTITLTWADGTPASGLPIQITHLLQTETQLIAGEPTARTHEAQADPQGQHTFSLEMRDPTALLPGDHILSASALRGDRTDTATAPYTITA
jgi:N-acetylneuraminic acid mutarotase